MYVQIHHVGCFMRVINDIHHGGHRQGGRLSARSNCRVASARWYFECDATVQLDEYNVTGLQSSPVSTIAIPSSGVDKLTTFGNYLDGALKLSSDGNYLTLGGYDAVPGTTNTSFFPTVKWVVGRVTVGNGTVDLSTKIANIANNSSSLSGPHNAATSNGSDIWVAGYFGVGYTTLGSSTLTRVNQALERNTVGIFGGQLYTTGAVTSGATYLMGTVGNGLPKTPTSMESSLPGLPTTFDANFLDFWFRDPNTLYLTTLDTFSGVSPGIQKWTFNGTSWQYQYSLLTFGVNYLSGWVDPTGNTVLFATSGGGSDSLLRIVDGGSQALSTSSVLATAPAGTSFQGLAFIASVPEPSSLLLMALGGLALPPLIRLRRRRIAIKS